MKVVTKKAVIIKLNSKGAEKLKSALEKCLTGQVGFRNDILSESEIEILKELKDNL